MSTLPRSLTSSRSSANSVGVRCSGSPRRLTCWLARSTSTPPASATRVEASPAPGAGRVRRSVAAIRAVAGLDEGDVVEPPQPPVEEHVNGWDEALVVNGAGDEAHAHN